MGLTGEPAPPERQQQADSYHGDQLPFVRPGQVVDQYQVCIPIDVKAGQQKYEGDEIDDPVPAQTGAQGAAAGIEQVLFELTGGSACVNGLHGTPRPKRDKSLALADQTPTISATH